MAKTPSVGTETVRVQRIYDSMGGNYDRLGRTAERLLFSGGRAWVCGRARGDVLEIAIGTGLNLPYYPSDIRLTGIDFSAAMLAVARTRARRLGRTVHLCLGDAHALAFADNSFDSVVVTLALCTIPDHRQAIREAGRVLRPGGRLLTLEHIRSKNRVLRVVLRRLEPLTLRLQADHLLRDPVDHLAEAGLESERIELSRAGMVQRLAARKRG